MLWQEGLLSTLLLFERKIYQDLHKSTNCLTEADSIARFFIFNY